MWETLLSIFKEMHYVWAFLHSTTRIVVSASPTLSPFLCHQMQILCMYKYVCTCGAATLFAVARSLCSNQSHVTWNLVLFVGHLWWTGLQSGSRQSIIIISIHKLKWRWMWIQSITDLRTNDTQEIVYMMRDIYIGQSIQNEGANRIKMKQKHGIH